MEPLILQGLVSNASVPIATTATQVSGGTTPLTGETQQPARDRLTIRMTNTSASATIYLGADNQVTAAAGGKWWTSLAPGQGIDDSSNGSVPIWAIASGASATLTVVEYD